MNLLKILVILLSFSHQTTIFAKKPKKIGKFLINSNFEGELAKRRTFVDGHYLFWIDYKKRIKTSTGKEVPSFDMIKKSLDPELRKRFDLKVHGNERMVIISGPKKKIDQDVLKAIAKIEIKP